MFASDNWIRERAGVHRSTITRWRATQKYPPVLARLAELELAGRVELIHTDWQGWQLDPRTGELVTPGGERYRPGEILGMPIRRQLVRALKRDNNRLRAWRIDPVRSVRYALFRSIRFLFGRGRRRAPAN